MQYPAVTMATRGFATDLKSDTKLGPNSPPSKNLNSQYGKITEDTKTEISTGANNGSDGLSTDSILDQN